MSTTSTNQLIYWLRWIAVLPASLVGFAFYLVLGWLLLLMLSTFISGSFYVLLTLAVTLIFNSMSGYSAIKAGSLIAPTRTFQSALTLVLLYVSATIVGVIVSWRNVSN